VKHLPYFEYICPACQFILKVYWTS